MTASSQRRLSREAALQVLFLCEFSQDNSFDQSVEAFRTNFVASQEVWKYAKTLIYGVRENQKEIDSNIKSHARNWSLDRMALVDLILMRIAVFEILFSEETVPPKVAMDEAIELAKKFSSKDSSGFINGILDQITQNGLD